MPTINNKIASTKISAGLNLEKSVESRKSTQAPSKPEKALITSKVTTCFSDAPCTPITYASFSRPSDFSRLNVLSFGVLACLSFYSMAVHASNVLSCTSENTAIIATTTHLTDNNDGTISDPRTGLIWKKCSEGLSWNTTGGGCTGTLATYNWQAAMQRAQAVNGGTGESFLHTDWRVPNIKELASIVEQRCSSPVINNTVFPNTSAQFWSSSPSAANSASAWNVNFSSGFDGAVGKDSLYHVRLVRSGQ